MVEALLRSFDTVLHQFAFKRVPKRSSFHCVTPYGWRGIHVPITRYLDGAIVVALTAIIRFDAVERIVQTFTERPSYVDGPNRGTLALFMTADAGEDSGSSFKIEQADDLSEAAAWAKRRLEAQALPFFEAFPTLDRAYGALVGSEPTSPLFDFPFAQERGKRVLAAAIVLGRVAELPRLVATERERLWDDPQAIVAEFDDFATKVKAAYR